MICDNFNPISEDALTDEQRAILDLLDRVKRLEGRLDMICPSSASTKPPRKVIYLPLKECAK